MHHVDTLLAHQLAQRLDVVQPLAVFALADGQLHLRGYRGQGRHVGGQPHLVARLAVGLGQGYGVGHGASKKIGGQNV